VAAFLEAHQLHGDHAEKAENDEDQGLSIKEVGESLRKSWGLLHQGG
jgi:hypothetical protein